MKKLLTDFRDFVARGDVMDLAIGIIIGSAFSAIVNSVVNNLLMPPLGLLIGNVDFQDLFVVLKQGQTALPADATLQMAKDAGAVTFNYGQFVTDVISFLILAFVIFLMVKGLQTVKAKVAKAEAEAKAEPTEKECPFCMKSIDIKASRCPYCTSELEK
ncbi:large conductance mechanosensitive channel protein MscL [Chloroflexota bacterium]|nr:large conductance mechanosensitive channel protein MscL [Chloroflexota bacterium]